MPSNSEKKSFEVGLRFLSITGGVRLKIFVFNPQTMYFIDLNTPSSVSDLLLRN